MVIALATASPAGAANAKGPDVVAGFGPFSFGMTVADAMHAMPRARLMRCAFPDHFKHCVEYDDKVYGMPAIVRARFAPDQKLDAVFVQFDALGGASGSEACRRTAVAVLGRLRDDYGLNTLPKPGQTADAKSAALGRPAADGKGDAKAAPKDDTKAAAKPGPAKDAKGGAKTAAAGAAARRPDLFLWFPPKGGKIGLVDLCTGDDAGIVYIIFTPSSVPGRKAS
ncbi:MAG: hypothetical protein ACM3N5_05220 [Candidatus Eiseniibacteriota bacterium]